MSYSNLKTVRANSIVRSRLSVLAMRRTRARRAVGFAWKFLIAVLFLSPLLMGLSYSFRTDAEIMMTRGVTLLPRVWTIENYQWVFVYVPVLTYLKNSILHYVLMVGSQVIFCSMTAYAFANFKFHGKSFLFNCILFAMMIPGEVTVITNFLQIQKWGMLNTYIGMVITGLVSSLGIFTLRQFYLSLPKELKEAAILDGCGDIGFWFRIALPLSVPTIASMAIYEFVTIYNRYLWPLLVAKRSNMYTIQIGMDMLKSSEGDNLGLILAGAVICIVPVVLVFVFGQKYIIRGMVSGGVKG
ncbi:MAG: carbohydrate ABC transporter permease [Spirochaetales bacterium]|nr:carbohydrate ABC transporter permease [Spirochaetales bacterium]